MSRREEVLAAAVHVLGEYGLSGFSHRKVDHRAGLPEGTTSNYFRTRAALIEASVEQLVAGDFQVWERAGAPQLSSTEKLVDLACGFVEWALTDGRNRSCAQIALLEAAITHPGVSAVLRRARSQIENQAIDICASIGIGSIGTVILLDATDALIFRQLSLSEAHFDPRVYFETLIEGLAKSGI